MAKAWCKGNFSCSETAVGGGVFYHGFIVSPVLFLDGQRSKRVFEGGNYPGNESVDRSIRG